MNRAGAAAILRFKHEFRTLLGVAHPNLVTLYELISDGQNWFLTMELLDGVSFLAVRTRGIRPRSRAAAPGSGANRLRRASASGSARRFASSREGIAWLHAAGKLHRDIKPTNVIVTREGRVVLLDFGLVGRARARWPAPEHRGAHSRHGRLHGTRAGGRLAGLAGHATGTAWA